MLSPFWRSMDTKLIKLRLIRYGAGSWRNDTPLVSSRCDAGPDSFPSAAAVRHQNPPSRLNICNATWLWSDGWRMSQCMYSWWWGSSASMTWPKTGSFCFTLSQSQEGMWSGLLWRSANGIHKSTHTCFEYYIWYISITAIGPAVLKYTWPETDGTIERKYCQYFWL